LTLAVGATRVLRLVGRPLIGRRQGRVAVPATASRGNFSVIATAALTSAGVTMLVMWLWGQVTDPNGLQFAGVMSNTSGLTPALLEARALAAPVTLTGLAPSPRPSIPPLRAPQPVVATPTRVPPVSVPQAVKAAEPTPARTEPAAPAPMQRVAVARVAETAPPAAEASSTALSAAEPDAGARATGTSGGSGLMVITEPEGARVTINGVGWGTTPVAIPYLSSGSKRVRVTKPGYESEERVIEPGSSRTGATVRIELRETGVGRLPQ
jgi:hypothetical protein